LTGAPSSIGTVRSPQQFRVNGSEIHGNSTLFEGDVVETGDARSIVQLADGQLTLMPASRARIFHDHTVLERGSETLSAAQGQSVEAVSLRIAPAVRESVVQVEISAPNRVSVAAQGGAAEVRSSAGVLVASVRPGMALAFDPHAAGASTFMATGKLESSNGKFYLTDQNTAVRYELRGPALAGRTGQSVKVGGAGVPGAAVATGVSQAIQVATIETAAYALPTGAAGAAQGPAPARLDISILEGEGAINDIRQRVAREAAVQVNDENHRPVAGALVTFILPDSGPGGVFSNGAHSLSVMTDNAGRAVAQGIFPNKVAGDVQMHVVAHFGNLNGNATIRSRNVASAAAAAAAIAAAGGGGIAGASGGAATGGLSSLAVIGIVGGVAIVGVVGGLAAAGAFSGSSGSAASIP
jgi:hypothetical protein